MVRKLLLEQSAGQVRTFLLEDGAVAEIHLANTDDSENGESRVGDILVGRVKTIVPKIAAAFVEISAQEEAYFDLSDVPYTVFTHKSGKKELCVGDELVVQVSREAMQSKKCTVTARISLTGHYAVLTRGNTRLGVSGKIPASERGAFRELLAGFENNEYGIIVRTNAREAKPDEVKAEIISLTEKYRQILKKALSRPAFSRLYTSLPSYLADLNNVCTDGLEEILVEGDELYTSIHEFLSRKMPDMLPALRQYDNPSFPLCKCFGTDKVLEDACKKKVWLKHGGFLVIEHTEALTVIDVNSGKDVRSSKGTDKLLSVNLEAAKECARQIRLRSLSGIILVDFINMKEKESEEELVRFFRAELARDPVPTAFADMTALGLAEVTRKKVRRPLHESVNMPKDARTR